MDLIIYSYGYSELIFHVLQGLAMFRNSGFYGTVINSTALLVGTFYAWQMAGARAEGQWRGYLLKCLGMVIFVNSLLLPKASMLVKDHVEKSIWKVDNIPLAFALPVGAVESFGHVLTMGFEQVFSLVGNRSSLMYYHYGTVFGARLAKEVSEAKIRDPEVVANMHNFIKRCVILPASIGNKFSKEELAATTDIWGLISKNAGELSRTPMHINGKRKDPSPTCKEAVIYFEDKFAKETTGIIDRLANKFRGAGHGASYNEGLRGLNKSIKTAIAAVYGTEHKVESIIKHNMMINAINDYRSGKYATARAQMHQEAGGLLAGDLAEKTLTGSLAVMKVMVYGAFVFLLPLLIVSGGIQKYTGWITMAFSLSLWPPLFSMLNMIIDFAYDPAKIVSYSSWSTEKQKFDSIASLAANLTISIPFLSYWITRMGEGGFTHLAGSVMATVNSATGAIAGERSVGTRNWDNDSIGNSSRDMISSGKTNQNLEYVSGEQSWASSDGSFVRLTGGGTSVISGGQGRTSSSGDVSFRAEEAVQSSLSEHMAHSKTLADSDYRSWSDAQVLTTSKAASYLKTIAEHTKSGQGYNIDTSTEEGKSINTALENIDTMTESNGYSWQQNAESYIGANASISTPGKQTFGTGASGEVGGKVSAANNSTQNSAEDQQIQNKTGTSESKGHVLRALSSDSWAKENGFDQSLSTDVRKAYEQSQRLESQYGKRLDDVDTYDKALQYSKTHGASSSRDMYQDVLETYAKEKGISTVDARKDVEKRTPEVMQVFNRIAGGEASGVVNRIRQTKEQRFDNAETELDNFSGSHQEALNSNVEKEVRRSAKNDGFNSETAQRNIESKKNLVEEQASSMNQSIESQYSGLKQVNQNTQSIMKAQVDKYEEDRIGKDYISQRLEKSFYNPVSKKSMITPVGRPKDEGNKGQTVTNTDNLEDIKPIYKLYTGDKNDR